MPLKVIIAGGGIAGLVSAIALRQAGHSAIVLEQHDLTSVIGAAVNVNPNGLLVLLRLGFDVERARACVPRRWRMLRGQDMGTVNAVNLYDMPGHPKPGTITIHRADLHCELVRLATADAGNGSETWGPPAELRSASPVKRISDDGTGVVLESGEEVRGDVIIGADGVHSVVRSYVGEEPNKPQHSGLCAFRFLIESDKLRADEQLAIMLGEFKDDLNLISDHAEKEKEKTLVWYQCRSGETQNFAGIHPSNQTEIESNSDEVKKQMMCEFGHYDPRIRKIISMSSHMKRWPLLLHNPLPTWIRGRVIVIGDAAHPMLPFGGQGATQAMEDGAALGCLLKGCRPVDVGKALCSFEKLRRNRATRVQLMSHVRLGMESEAADKLTPFLDEAVPVAPSTIPGRVNHDFSYDIYAACEAASS